MAKMKQGSPMVPFLYDLMLWVLSVLVDLFFREVHPRGSWRIPREGPVIFVAAPHANQFVDPLILMRVVRTEAKRRFSILTAAKSMDRKFVGACARTVGAIPVGRALDSAKKAAGTIYLPDPQNDPLLIQGVDSQFDKQAMPGGLIVLPTVNKETPTGEIAEVLGPDRLRLKKPIKGDVALKQLSASEQSSSETAEARKGTSYKTAPKVDQTEVYNAVFERLNDNGCVCIFPEGGSHDRTELLPLKAGVAIMALGSLAANPTSGLKIVPCGMNYFHAHKFRSRSVVEFGPPIEVPPELVEMYSKGEKREATRQMLEIIYQALVAVTVTSPDYDTLMIIQAARRLYNPKSKKLPLPAIVELNRRLAKGYEKYKDDPRLIRLKDEVKAYNKQLWLLGVRDHQVEYAKFSIAKVVLTLIYRLLKLGVLAIGTLPGLVLFAPVFVASKLISIKKSREALAASTVKLQGRDVLATWKLLVAMAFAPLLYTFYTVLLTYWTYRNRVQGYVPEWLPLWSIVLFGYVFFTAITFAALHIGETGMDILKSLRPLVLSLNPSSANTLHRLRETRAHLSAEVTDIINTLGPEMFSDFESTRLVPNPFKEGVLEDPPSDSPRTPRTPSTPSGGHSRNTSSSFFFSSPSQRANNHTNHERAGGGKPTNAHGNLPRNESFGNLSNIGFFASRPPSRSRSRNNTMSSGLSMTTPVNLEEVSKKIRGAMHERGKERSRRKSASEESWEGVGGEGESSGVLTPGSDEGKKDI